MPACALAVLVLLPTAAAHAEALATTPEDQARLESIPVEVHVLLSERVDPGSARLEVRDASGQRWDNDDIVVEDHMHPHIRVTMRPDAPDAGYLARWSVLSEVDGHTTSGTFGFAVGPFDPVEADEAAAERPLLSPLGRTLVYVGLSLAYGAAAFLVWMRPTPFLPAIAHQGLVAGAGIHAAGAVLFAASVWASSGNGLPDFAASRIGVELAIRLGLALGAVVLLARRSVAQAGDMARGGAILLLAGAGLMSSRLGHLAAFGASRVVVDFLHLALGAVWVGGLALLLRFLMTAHPEPEEVRRVGLRFGTLALVCVAGIGVTGLVSSLALLDVRALPEALWRSAYGRVLAAKVALVALMVLAAAVGRLRYLAAAGPPLRVKTTVAWELGVGCIVLVLAAFLASIAPPG